MVIIVYKKEIIRNQALKNIQLYIYNITSFYSIRLGLFEVFFISTEMEPSIYVFIIMLTCFIENELCLYKERSKNIHIYI